MTSDPSTESKPNEKNLTGKEAYNVVSDTVTGVNVRGSDNLLQAIFIFGSVVLFAVIGAIASWLTPSWGLPWYAGALVFGFGGMVVGVFTSGIFLMIYRMMRHTQGKHD